ncbi:MAG: pyridoxamine 5'-phosphate oxidase family protein [Acidimicrobiales bacterium]
MDTPVGRDALAERIDELGPVAHLVTVASTGRPHVVAVRAAWDGDELVVAAGRHTSANAVDHPDVSLVWAAPPGQGYSLIVDGTARPRPGASEPSLAVTPTRAVLHRTPEGDPAAPSCITVLARD